MIFCFYIFIISYDYGFLSDLFYKKICIKIMSCQMEMYLFQNTINNIIYKINKTFKYEIEINKEMNFLIKLLIIFFVAYLYKSLLKINTLVQKQELTFDNLCKYNSDVKLVIPFSSKDFFNRFNTVFKDIYISYENDYEKKNSNIITKNIVC